VSVVHLVPICLPGYTGLLDDVGNRIAKAFSTKVAIRLPRFDPETAFDSSRGQYHSTVILESLLADSGDGEGRILGIAGIDLFIPILTYVFGEAQLDGRAALVSIYRLDNARYGLPGNASLLSERLAKEAIHELGHTAGLVHCHHPVCVMRSSTYVEDIDVKSADFCPDCLKDLRKTAVRI
jgi:archaemetzincin